MPVFLIESGPDTRLMDIVVELADATDAFPAGVCARFASGLRLERGGKVTWQVPSDAWERLASFPRIFYRAVGTTAAGRRVYSLDDGLARELPFLHGRPSDAFYTPSLVLPSLPPLSVADAAVRREGTSAPFVFRGVTVSGLNHARYFHGPAGPETEGEPAARRVQRWIDAAHVTPALLDRLREMRVNLIRLPLNQDWLLMGYHEPELPEFAQGEMSEYMRYLEDIDQVIAWAGERCIYVMLSLHTLRLSGPAKGVIDPLRDPLRRRLHDEARRQPYNAHLPDHRSWLFWSVLAQRYNGCSTVMFDLCNEPHEVNPSYWDGDEYRGMLPPGSALRAALDPEAQLSWWRAEWTRLAEALEGLVHRYNRDALVFVSGFGGPCWSASLERMQFRSQAGNPNIVLAVHWYWSRSLGPDTWRRYLGFNKPDGTTTDMPQVRYPVFVKEWGIETPGAITQEPASQPAGDEYRRHWQNRAMPDYETLTGWGSRLIDFFAGLAARRGERADGGFAGFAAWSTGDKPRIFEREMIYTGPYMHGFPLTDYGEIVENGISRLAAIADAEVDAGPA